MPYRVACSRLTACVIAVLIHWAQLQGGAAGEAWLCRLWRARKLACSAAQLLRGFNSAC